MTAAVGVMDLARLAPAKGTRLAIVGGCGGIGTRLVEVALASGLQVVNLDLAVSMQKRPALPGEWQIECDASKSADINQAFAAIDMKWGALDAMVHLAGFTPPPKPTRDTSDESWDEVMNVNTRGAFLSARAALPLLDKGRDPAVVLTSSGLSVSADKGVGPYAAAKAAINAMTRNLAKENAPSIRVNAVAPGPIETAFLSGGAGRGGDVNAKGGWFETGRTAIEATIPQGRVGQPDDVVGPILFLLGQASRYMTGQILYINGGRLMF
jgi:3-oxoacyl-[acyl-carrier protein] reductase